MNLIELSKKTNQSIDSLKDEILNQFGRIILTEYLPIQNEIVDYFCLNSKKEKKNLDKISDLDSKKKKCPEPSRQMQHPELVYTKKLLNYCMENHYLIFIDTCSLVDDNFKDFYQIFVEQKKNFDTVLHVPHSVTQELKKHAFNKKEKEKIRKAAEEALRIIDRERNKGNIVVVGNEKDKRDNKNGVKTFFADPIFYEKMAALRNVSKSSLLITQDGNLTCDVLTNNRLKSINSTAVILVKSIERGGILKNHWKIKKENITYPKLPIDV
ncbi:MAG: hypothetical protein MR466_04305 [Ruminococcus sp.]|nr:hypothetical protein [Ruminococcus sp.]